jgi:hypothetical protein
MRVEAPICSGSGSNLPGLLGLRTIEEKRGVIETTCGQAFLTFPGPGGYRIVWEPGALHLPLSKAPSGHLCIELDHFNALQPEVGLPQRQLTLLSRAGNADDQAAVAEAGEENRRNIRPPLEDTITPFRCLCVVGKPDQYFCGEPCIRGSYLGFENPMHTHEGECRCRYHYRNRYGEDTPMQDADGDG